EDKPQARRLLLTGPWRRARNPYRPARELSFAAKRLPRKNRFAANARRRVDRLQRRALRGADSHQLGAGVDRARARIFHHAVFHAVERVARVEDLLRNQLQRLRRNERCQIFWVWKLRTHVLDELRTDPRKIRRRRAGDDPIEVVGKPLRFHESLTTAVGATKKVRA